MVTSLVYIGLWLSVSALVYILNESYNTNKDKLKVMSVRKTLKQYKKLNDADNKSIF